MTSGIPVLMYHSLEGKSLSSLKNKTRSTTISLEDFEIQMLKLYELGYRTVGIDDFFAEQNIQHDKSFIITFDDGFYSTFKDAAPVLKKYNFTATLFLPVNPVGKPSFQEFTGFSGIFSDRPLTWEEIREMQKEGWSIQSHGMNHPRLSELSSEQIWAEINNSKAIIEEQTGKPINYFAYPFGDYDQRVLAAIGNANYKGAFTVHTGKTSRKEDPFRCRRIEVNNQDSLEVFLRKMETGYGSKKEQWRSLLRDLLFQNPAIKDFLKSLKK